MQKRIKSIDTIKGLCLIAIISFHLGFFPGGFIAVDVFLIISTMFLTKKVLKFEKVKEAGTYIINRIIALWIPMSIVVLFCLIYWRIDYDRIFALKLDQQAMQSLFFIENIQNILEQSNYWTSSATMTPLTPLWYASLLAQLTVFLILISTLFIKLKNKKIYLGIVISILLLLSIALPFIFPLNFSMLYYSLPTRLYAPMIGALVGLFTSREYKMTKNNKLFSNACSFILLFGIISSFFFIKLDDIYLFKGELIFFSVLVGIFLFLLQIDKKNLVSKFLDKLPIFNYFGSQSYTFYFWHWPIILILQKQSENLRLLPIILIIILIILNIFYYIFEKREVKSIKTLVLVFTIILSFNFIGNYMPLGISTIFRNDVIVYGEAEDNLLVLGDSWARSLANGMINTIDINEKKVINAGINGCGIMNPENFIADELSEGLEQACLKGSGRGLDLIHQYSVNNTLIVLGSFDIQFEINSIEDTMKFYERYSDYVKELKTLESEVIVVTIGMDHENTQSINEAIKRVADENNVKLIDLYRYIEENGQILQYDQSGHLDERSEKIVGKWILEQL